MSETTPSFEETYHQLESIVEALETGEVSLEEALALYEQGHALAQQCTTMLDHAELRVSQLRDQEDGSIASEPYEF